MSTQGNRPRMDRRMAIKWMLSAAATISILDQASLASEGQAPKPKGYGTDPDLSKIYKPGDLWPLTFSATQRITAIALCDVIIPADNRSPKASDLGVHDFIDEWISAPYPVQSADRRIVLDGLDWINAEANRRFQNDFAALVHTQQIAICDQICDPAKAKPEHKSAVVFFKKYRDLTSGGFYTTPEGMKDIGYVGNIPLPAFDGPPREVLEKLGLV